MTRCRQIVDDGVGVVERENGSAYRRSLFTYIDQADYSQVITPLVISQVLADCECVAVALHEGGGPATLVTTTVTFCEGLKPWRGAAEVAVPPKYAPPLSAAYCSS